MRNDDIEILRELHARLTMLNADQVNVTIDVLRRVKKNEYSNADLCDLGFFLRELEQLADEVRKECLAKKEFIGKFLCLKVAKKLTEDPDAGLIVRGEFSNGTADIKKAAGLPKWGTPEYSLLCEHFGISEEVQKTKVVQFHFKHVAEYISDLAAQGKNVPPGINKTYDIYRINWRKKR